MFFALSKVLDLFASPLTWGLFFAALAAWFARPTRLRRRAAPPRAAQLTFASALAAIAVVYPFATAPVANALGRGLEASAVRTAKGGEVYDAVILLGGLVDAEATDSTHLTSYTDAVERLLTAFDLLRSDQARFALISGGSTNAHVRDAIEAQVLARQLEAWGIPPGRIVIEGESRNTRENAVLSANIVRARGWEKLVLVTSAFHMHRALGCFYAVGLAPDALPVDFRTYSPSQFSGSLLPRTTSLDQSTQSLREYLGRVVYRWRGYTSDEPPFPRRF